MSWNTFARSVVFAALAAAAWLPWILLASPIVGAWNARAFYLVVVTALYVAGLSPHSKRRLVLAALAAALGAVLAVTVRTTAELCIGLAAVLGILRGAFLYRSAPVRAVAIEVALLVGGLLFARFLASTSPLPTGVALWGFLLVQSLFFLVAGAAPRSRERRHGDPFEEAYRSAVAILDP